MITKITKSALVTLLLFTLSACGGGSGDGDTIASSNTTASSNTALAVDKLFNVEECVVEVEVDNLYGQKEVKCNNVSIGQYYEIDRFRDKIMRYPADKQVYATIVKKAPASKKTEPFFGIHIFSEKDKKLMLLGDVFTSDLKAPRYSLQVGEEFILEGRVSMKQKSSLSISDSELREYLNLGQDDNIPYYIKVPFKVKIVGVKKNKKRDMYIDTIRKKIPLLVIRVRDDANETFAADLNETHSYFYGFDIDQLSHTMMRNTGSQMIPIEANETQGVQSDGIIDVVLQDYKTTDVQGSRDIDGLTLVGVEALKQADGFIDFSSFDKNNDGVLSEKDELAIVLMFPKRKIAEVSNDSYVALAIKIPPSNDQYHYTSNDGIDVWGKNIPNGMTQEQFDTLATNRISFIQEYDIGKDLGEFTEITSSIYHELGHEMYGLVDLYDIDQSTDGLYSLGLMSDPDVKSNLSFDNETELRAIMCAYSAVRSGIITPIEINSTQTITLTPQEINATRNIFKLKTSKDNEFFYIENFLANPVRVNQKLIERDLGEFVDGVLITRVNNNQTNNRDENNRLVDVVYNLSKPLANSTIEEVTHSPFFEEGDIADNLYLSDGSDSGITIENIKYNPDGSITLDVVYP